MTLVLIGFMKSVLVQLSNQSQMEYPNLKTVKEFYPTDDITSGIASYNQMRKIITKPKNRKYEEVSE